MSGKIVPLFIALLAAFAILVSSNASAQNSLSAEDLRKANDKWKDKDYPDVESLLSDANKYGVVCTGDLTRMARLILCKDNVISAKEVAMYNERADWYDEQTRRNVRKSRFIINEPDDSDKSRGGTRVLCGDGSVKDVDDDLYRRKDLKGVSALCQGGVDVAPKWAEAIENPE
ncbi:MAG: hypothetical protein LBR53_02560 [Deltaproteobacteria bacterium]|jgi:hypothetical protein|nr:hypothetical protein [Deltaproteobacteria bacterium]